MARIQILELPEGASDDRPPFALIVDLCERADLGRTTQYADFGKAIGALNTLISEEPIELPGNWVTVDDDHVHRGTLRMKIEPDFTDWKEQIEEHIAGTQRRLADALRSSRTKPAPAPGTPIRR